MIYVVQKDFTGLENKKYEKASDDFYEELQELGKKYSFTADLDAQERIEDK